LSFIGNLQSAQNFFKIYFEVCIEVETDYGPGIVLKTAFLFCDSGVPALTFWIWKFWLNDYCVTEVVGSIFYDSILTKIELYWFTTDLYEVAVLLGSILLH